MTNDLNWNDLDTCSFCDGTGAVNCSTCRNLKYRCDDCEDSGQVECPKCQGSGMKTKE